MSGRGANNGADLVLIGGPDRIEDARAAILAAARRGKLPRSRLEEAAGRVLKPKRQLGLL
jgi:beta-glucosidase-like glycosyl hydrolase